MVLGSSLLRPKLVRSKSRIAAQVPKPKDADLCLVFGELYGASGLLKLVRLRGDSSYKRRNGDTDLQCTQRTSDSA